MTLSACSRCGRLVDGTGWMWRCPCTGLLDHAGGGFPPPVDLGLAESTSITVAAGERLKLDFEQPTGSFKDRGTSTMIGLAVASGARSVVCDSSGNAGRSVAAHAAAAGLACSVYVPEGTAAAKVAAMESAGAEVIVGGDRSAAAAAARSRADRGEDWYASHVYQPSFHHGVASLAGELAGAGTVVVPAGNGTLVIGLWLGFRRSDGPVPQIVAVQAERCAPLVGRHPTGTTAASGIAITDPPRAGQVRAAVLASGGRVLTVAEAEIDAARGDLLQRGFSVDATGGVAWAARPQVVGKAPVVYVLTGR